MKPIPIITEYVLASKKLDFFLSNPLMTQMINAPITLIK